MRTEQFIKKFEKENDGKTGFLFFAPGRVNLIGDHTDYTGGYVLPAAINFGTYLFVKRTGNKVLKFSSENIAGNFEVEFSQIKQPHKSWIDYPLGVINQLIDKGWNPEGLEFVYYGDIPNGAGLSSSASIEMVTAFAINTIFDLGIAEKETVLLSQKAENEFVGVQCGIMDQYAVGFGKPQNALMIDCNEITHRYVEIPFDEYKFVVVNSNKKRGLLDSAYNQRVNELQKAKEIINRSFEVPYLGSLTPEDADWIEKLITGETLLKRIRHIVNENARVKIAAEYLKTNNPLKFGEMMIHSHESLKHDFEVSCFELDTLVEIALNTGGVAGARMTGAGFGGCTINLVKNDSLKLFSEKIEKEYKQKTGLNPEIYPIEISGELKRL